ncbi:hypothetical protein Tco_0870212, partial [Tanacetum coccineum]
MKRGFRGAPRPLFPAMLLVDIISSAGQEHPDVAQSQPSSSKIPVPSTSSPPVQSPPPITAPIPETDPEPMEHTFEEPSPAHQHFLPPQEHVQGQMTFGKEGEEAGRDEAIRLAEAIRLDTLEKEEEGKQVQLISLLAQRIAEKKKFNEQQKQRSAQKTGKRRKQIARKGLHSDKTDEDESEASKDADPISGTNISINPVPVAIKPPSIATYKIIKQGKYRIVMNRYGMNGPEDELEKVLWEYLKNMFEAPLSTDPIWSLLGQQRIISWRYYNTCRVHCLNLESMDIYMLIERKYPLSAEVCKAMLDKKLQGGKPDEDCYKLLKMMEKQAGIRKHKDWLVQEQTALGKDFSNPLMADNLPKIIWLSTHHISRGNLNLECVVLPAGRSNEAIPDEATAKTILPF